MDVPCPPMNFVAESVVISAPCSIGLTSPTPVVLSTTKGIPAS